MSVTPKSALRYIPIACVLPLMFALTLVLALVAVPLPSHAANGPNVVALFGDSITVGFNTTLRDRFANGTTTRGAPTTALTDILNRSGRRSVVVNWGIGGSSSSPGPRGRSNSGISRIRSNLADTMNTHDGSEYFVLIMYGANDQNSDISASTTGFNIGEMVRLARLEGFTPIASTITPNSGFSVAPFNSRIRSAVNARNAPLVDNFALFNNIPNVFSNSTYFDPEGGVFLHPTNFGYELIAQNWFDNALRDMIPANNNSIASVISFLLNDEPSVPPPAASSINNP